MIYFLMIIWVIGSFIAAHKARDGQLGFFRTLLISLVITPIAGYLLSRSMTEKEKERISKEDQLISKECANCGQIVRVLDEASEICPLCRHRMSTGVWTWQCTFNNPLFFSFAGSRPSLIEYGSIELREGEESATTYSLFSKKVLKRALIESLTSPMSFFGSQMAIILMILGVVVIWNFSSLIGFSVGVGMMAIAGFILREKLLSAQKNIYLEGAKRDEERENVRPR